MIHNFLIGYAAYLLGFVLYILGKVDEYKRTAKSIPNPTVKFSMRKFWDEEWINMVRLLVGGVALVIFAPKLFASAHAVDVINSNGEKVTSLLMASILPFIYFLLALSGSSAVFNFFGKYKKTLIDPIISDNG